MMKGTKGLSLVFVLLLGFAGLFCSSDAKACDFPAREILGACVEFTPEEVKEIFAELMCNMSTCDDDNYILKGAQNAAMRDSLATGIPADIVHLDISAVWGNGNGMMIDRVGTRHYENSPGGWKECFYPSNYVTNQNRCDGL